MKKYVASNITDMAKNKVNELGYSYKVDVKPTEWDYKKTIMVDGFTSYQAKKKQEVVDISELRLLEKIDEVYQNIEKKGVDSIYSTFFLGERWLEMPRKIDVLLFIDRMRYIVVDNDI